VSRPALPQALTQALNVDPASNFFSGDNGVGFNYTLTERSVFRVFDAAIAKGFKVLVYNGDTDPGVNMVAIQDIAAAFAQEYATTPFFQCIFVTFEQVLYVFAHIKGERFDEEDNSAKSMGIDTDKMKKDASDKAAKKAIQTARENPEQARNLAAKAATGII
jgi:hypothetical protein